MNKWIITKSRIDRSRTDKNERNFKLIWFATSQTKFMNSKLYDRNMKRSCQKSLDRMFFFWPHFFPLFFSFFLNLIENVWKVCWVYPRNEHCINERIAWTFALWTAYPRGEFRVLVEATTTALRARWCFSFFIILFFLIHAIKLGYESKLCFDLSQPVHHLLDKMKKN